MNFKIPFNKPFIVGNELKYISEAVSNGRLSGDGDFTRRCHVWLESHLNCEKALLTHSGTAALEMAAILADIQPGDEVILPSYTFVSTANAFVLRGAIPVFIDIRQDTLNMDEMLIESAITPRTKAIVPVHYAGVPCEMDSIMTLAKKYNIYVIEDAAQALMTQYHGEFLGAIGDMGCVSFHETKNIISGEGGAIFINNEQLRNRAEIIWEKGTNRKSFLRGDVDKYTWIDIGSSFLPSELTSAFLFAQLECAEFIIKRRYEICERYNNGFKGLSNKGIVRLPDFSTESSSNGHLYYLILRSLDERQSLMAYLKSLGILAVFHYVPLHSSPIGIRLGRKGSAMTVTDHISEKLLRLPVFYQMTDHEVDQVIDAIFSFMYTY